MVEIHIAGTDWFLLAATVVAAAATSALGVAAFWQIKLSRGEIRRRYKPQLVPIVTSGPPRPRARVYNEGGGFAKTIELRLWLVPPGGEPDGAPDWGSTQSILRSGEEAILTLSGATSHSLLDSPHDQAWCLSYFDIDDERHVTEFRRTWETSDQPAGGFGLDGIDEPE